MDSRASVHYNRERRGEIAVDSVDLGTIKNKWLRHCGACDAGLPMSCVCPTEDYRPVMLELVREIERLRALENISTEFVPVPGHPQYQINRNGVVLGKSGARLKTFPDSRGYPRFNTYVDGVWQQVGVHAKVCEAFHGPRPEGHHAAHLDGNPANCSADNLAWKLPVDNEADKDLHGTRMWGERHHQAKLTEAAVRDIRSSAEPLKVLADRYGVTKSAVCAIRNGRSWKRLK